MLRFLLRIAGYFAIAAGFVGLMIDGARSIANSALAFTPLNEIVARFLGERLSALQPAIERHLHPLVWDPVILNFLRLPAGAVALLLGFWLLWLGRRPERQIGYVTRQ
jgi:hypothetical protein